MKKIFALVFILVLGKMSYSQNYPLTQQLGSDSTIVISKGALQSRLAPIVISDTTAANNQRIKNYPGAQLYTANGDFYVRNATATKWVLVSSGSSGPINIYNSDGTLTGNRVLTGAGNSLTFNGISGLGINKVADSVFTVEGGIHATGGLRLDNLTSSPGTKTLRIDGQGVVSVADTTVSGGTVTSVGLTMPTAFNVSGSPITSAGTLSVTAAGVASQYIRGDGQLATLPTTGGGGSSVSYYLNGSVNQGTFGGNTYYQMNKTPVIGTGTDFTISSNGYIASFITDAGDPDLLNIPAGNWDFEIYFQSSSNSGTPSFYVELYKYNGTTFTLIASSSTNPKFITSGTNVDAYYTPLPVPATTLAITDRLAIRVYVNNSGNTITLHTEDNNLCQVITTFSTGINALNGLTDQVQYFAVGTSGTDFNISSLTDTHTFNLPTASATNRGALSSADWTTFNGKVGGSGTSGQVSYFNGTNSITSSPTFAFTPTSQLLVNNSVTAASAIARGVNFTNTLVAAANNDVLVGLDINPTFTINTALINTSSYLRISGTYAPPSFSANNTVYGIDISPTFTNANLAVGMRINPIFTNVTSGSGWALSIDNSTFGGIRQTSSLIPNNFVGNTYIGSFANFTSSQQLNVNNSIKLGSAGANQHFIIAHSEGGATFSSLANTFNSDAAVMDFRMKGNTTTENAMRIWGTRNITIGSNTDAGFRLDVNGTARVQGATTISGSVNSTATNQYFNTWQGTQNVSGIAAFGTTVHTYFNPTISSSSTNLRPVALSVVPTFSGTIDTKVAVFASTSGSAAVTLGANAAFLASSSETNAVGLLSSVSGTNSSGVMISSTPTIGLNITSNPTIAIRINSVSTTGAFTPFETIQLLSGTPTASRYIVRNTTASNSTVISTFDFINSSTSSTGGALGNNAGIQLRLGISNPTFQERYTSIAAIAPNQTSLPDVVDLRFQVSNASGTTTNALYLSSQGHTLTTFDNTTGLTISGSSLTGSNAQSLVSLSQTWNTTGNPTAFLLNITNTASGATADLMDLQVGGASRFEITAAGRARLGAYGSGTITGTATYNLAVDASGNVIEVTGGGGGGIGGSGTTNRIAKFTASGTIGNSSIADSSSSVAMTISSLGNVGLGVTPSAWGSNFRAMQLFGPSVYSVLDDRGNVGFISNGYWDVTDNRWEYTGTGTSSNYQQFNGGHIWYTSSGSGTANTAISFTTAMTLNASGNLGLGTATIGSRLQVNGNAAIGYSASTAAPTNGLMVAGNVGVNVTPSAWASGFRAIQIGGRTALFNSDINITTLGNNIFYDGVSYKYITSAAGSSIDLGGNYMTFGTLASGTAGANATGVERARIHTDGIFYIGNGDAVASPNTGIISATGGSGTNIAGAEFRIRGGASTGSGAGGPITFYTSAAGSAGTTVNAATEIARFDTRGNLGINATPQSWGTSYRAIQIGQRGGLWAHTSAGSTYLSENIWDDGSASKYIVTGAAAGYQMASGAHYWYQAASGTGGANITLNTSMFLNTSNNLGIGTTTIGSRLQVNGNAAIGYSASTAAPTNGLAVAGNVGIGIAAPATNLHVYRTTAGLSGMQISNLTHGSTVTDGMFVGVDDTQGYIYMYENLPIQLSTNSTVRLFINNDGTVFVGGTNAPASPTTGILSGSGATGTNVAGAELRIRGGASTGNAAGGPITFYTAPTGTSGTTANAATERMRIYSDGMVRTFMSTTNTTQYFASARITIQQTSATNNNFANLSFLGANSDDAAAIYSQISAHTAGATSGNLVFATSNAASASTARMTITSTGLVGINTQTIGSQLQVNGGAAIGYSASTAAPTNGLAVAGDIIGAGNVRSSNGTINMAITWQTGPTYGIVGTLSNHDVSVWTNGSQKMLISTGGQVTLNTGANVSAIAQTGYSLTGSNAQSLIDLAGTWNTTGNPTAIKLNITNTASGANSLLMDLQVGGTPEFRVTRTGNVVVNGSTSTYQMHVVGTGSLLALGEESFTTGRQMLFGIDGSGNGEIQSVQQGTSYRNLSINPLGGNVGIATSSPTSTLNVNGSVAKAITTKTATYTLTSSDHTVIFNLNGNATANLPDATTCTGRIYMIKINRTNTTDTLTIDPNGTQTIDGFTTYALQCQYAVTIQSDGSNWQIVGDFGAGLNCL